MVSAAKMRQAVFTVQSQLELISSQMAAFVDQLPASPWEFPRHP
jgi:hypothetical protein